MNNKEKHLQLHRQVAIIYECTACTSLTSNDCGRCNLCHDIDHNGKLKCINKNEVKKKYLDNLMR